MPGSRASYWSVRLSYWETEWACTAGTRPCLSLRGALQEAAASPWGVHAEDQPSAQHPPWGRDPTKNLRKPWRAWEQADGGERTKLILLTG
ncbi:hypothetical protein DPEC_G00288020 [Dallia pectoralis]|uniref:Uncharacterized protein n=1 Tax=Dallia pectoralis TaxID=75939 RepID=A0ACC2FKD1_DALPE|nr:hypothetical protein DPEC_G00288020 [Dallia pectoralis]